LRQIDSRQDLDGGHGVCAVGFIDNADLATILPHTRRAKAAATSSSKTRGGNCWGDGGFLYVPYQAMIDYAGVATALFDVL